MAEKNLTSLCQLPSRRAFLRTTAGLGTGLALGSGISLPALASVGRRELRLVNAHTWEKLEIVYYTHGVYIDESLAQINHLMRDHRADKSTGMDPALLDQLLQIQTAFFTAEPIHVLSGYRTPETNAKLRKRSSGVAKYSLHMEGRAADIYIPGVTTRDLQAAALDMQAGGVGFYGRSGFVHMDTGKVRSWERA